MAGQCCPRKALPMLQQYDYTPKGQWETIAHIPVYIVRGPKPSAGVIVYSDIFGPASGRHHQICDQLAEDLNLLVVMPDFFDGEPVVKADGFGHGFFLSCGLLCWALRPGNVTAFAKMYADGKIQAETEDHIIPFMHTEVSKIAAVGFCAGAVMAFYLSGTGKFEAAVSFHPSLHTMLPKAGVDPLDVCSGIRCKQFVMVTKDEPAEWQPRGVAQEACDGAVGGNVWERTEQSHGYFTRGDIEADIDTAKAVAVGYDKMKRFLQENLE